MQPQVPPGWYPDPKGGLCKRYWDGAAWTESTVALDPPSVGSTPRPLPVVHAERKELNAFFVVLACLSAIPTLFFLLVFFNSQSPFSGLIFLWCSMWTYVWWSLRHR